MKCQMLFSLKNKKNIIRLASAELTQRVVKVNIPCLRQLTEASQSCTRTAWHKVLQTHMHMAQ